MRNATMFVFGFVAVFASGCYESYQVYGSDTTPLEICVVAVTTNAQDGADVTVDGTPIDGTAELQMGPHTFAASAIGYFPTSVVVEVGEACAPVELRLFPNLSSDYDLVLHNRIYDRLLLHLDQDEEGNLVGYDWYPERPDRAFQEFIGTVTVDGEVRLLSEDSVRLDLAGRWTPPGVGGIARISGTWTSAAGGDGDWLAESRP